MCADNSSLDIARIGHGFLEKERGRLMLVKCGGRGKEDGFGWGIERCKSCFAQLLLLSH